MGCIIVRTSRRAGRLKKTSALDNFFRLPDAVLDLFPVRQLSVRKLGSREHYWNGEVLERIRRAHLKHGRYTKRAKAERAEYRNLVAACKDMLAGL